ncbi:hypothetical protein [Qipengyuania nanhaisediminis]|uniref:hypothetical protein n=1 Tax=Qipengyuania nanhaisediminis TaxID=604088 RepID=UPI0038B37EA0
MRLNQIIERKPDDRRGFEHRSHRRKERRARPAAATRNIALHSLFVPLLTVWGAALFGLSVAVLPEGALAPVAALSGLDGLGALAKPVIALIAAAGGAATGFFTAAALRDKARSQLGCPAIVSAVKARNYALIDPVADLGSESLDAPLDEAETLADVDELAERQRAIAEAQADFDAEAHEITGSDITETGDAAETGDIADETEAVTSQTLPAPAEGLLAAKPVRGGGALPLGRPGTAGTWSLTQFSPPAPPPSPAPSPAPDADQADDKAPPAHDREAEKPIALDLAEFADLPGRDGVWVSEPTCDAASPDGNQSALDRLRGRSPEELSLAELVERLAGALNEHQNAAAARAPGDMAASMAGREAMLAEALKSLTAFTKEGLGTVEGSDAQGARIAASQIGTAERELRAALVKLQGLRGAA